jgi:hypothetical protein
MDRLVTPAAAYVARTAHLPWAWGRCDCALWPAGLVAEVTGRDPAAHLRGTYASAFACRQLLLREGGLLGLSRRLMAGVPAGGEGDGVAVAKIGEKTFAGVLSGGRLFIKTDGGVVSPEAFDLLERWSL